MATTVSEAEELALLDGTKIKVRPLKVSLLREFMKTFQGLVEAGEDNEKAMDAIMACVQVAMKQYKPELAEDKEKLEDVLDLPTVYKVIEAASGINLSAANALLALNTQE